MLDVIAHSQRGRVCEYKRGDASIRTPAVLETSESASGDMCVTVDGSGRTFHAMGVSVRLDWGLMPTVSSGVQSEVLCEDGVCVVRFPIPEGAAVPEDAEIVVVSNGYELRNDARKLVDNLIKAREFAGFGRLLAVLGLAEPSTLALVTYMGVDVTDDALPASMGLSGVSLVPEGEIAVGGDASAENRAEMARECAKVTAFTSAGRLRELVDQRAPSSPRSVAALRLFDNVGYAFQEEACSTVGCRFACNTTQALKRPDIRRYQECIMERYVKPEHKRVLVLLPCSAKKPYHTSKSHKAFASAIHTASHDTLVHEVIVTSPLGAVPRELDVMYPANSYDIPVTGEWKCEEKAMIRRMIGHIIDQGYDKVISHLGEDTELVAGLADMVETCVGDSTSPVSLTNLDAAVREATKGMEPVDYMIERRETVRSILAFQFGQDVADAIFADGAYAIGKFPYWKIFRDKETQLGMLTPERGMVSLTIDGARILASMGRSVVQMNDFELKGSLFAVGVVDADPSIREGDEAVIMCNGEVRGVGVAMMCGREMKELRRGVAVKVRHKI